MKIFMTIILVLIVLLGTPLLVFIRREVNAYRLPLWFGFVIGFIVLMGFFLTLMLSTPLYLS